MKLLLSYIILLSAFSMQGVFALRQPERQVADSLRQNMTKESSSFLRSLPKGLQARQAEAIEEAMGGRFEKLQAVRNSRNTPPPVPQGIAVEDLSPRLRMFRPADSRNTILPALVYLHGGGWCFGSINSCTKFCTELVQEAGIAVIAVDYPLAPEQPYPAALNTCIGFIKEIAADAERLRIDPQRISVGGDSAGGNLALAASIACSEKESNTSIHSLVLFYPVTYAGADHSVSWRKFGSGFGLDSGLMDAFNKAYISPSQIEDPLISPVLASESLLSELPPILLVSAEKDILLSQGCRMQCKTCCVTRYGTSFHNGSRTACGVQCRRKARGGIPIGVTAGSHSSKLVFSRHNAGTKPTRTPQYPSRLQ